ncbi:fas-binding factor 1 [Porphyrio hochstetteri]
MSKAQQTRQLGRLREELPNSTMSLLTREEDLSAPREGRSSRLGEIPAESARPSELAGGSSGRAQDTSSQGSKRSFLEDDFFGQVPGEAIKAAEPRDDVEADLLGSSSPGSGPGKRSAKGAGRPDCWGGAVKTPGQAQAPEKGQPVAGKKQQLASPSASRQDKEFDLEGLLSDEEQDGPNKLAPTAPQSSSEKKPEESKEKEPSPPWTPLHSVTPVQRRKELTFEVDSDDLIDMLGLGSGTQDEKSKQEKEDGWDDDDFLFGGDQRRAASRGRVGRRQSVSRFSGKSSWEPKPEPGSEPAASMSPVQARDSAAAWLGLKEEAAMDLESPFPSKASPAMSSRCRDTAGQPSPASQVPVMKEAAAKPSPAEEDDWLSSLLAQDKARGQAKAQERSAEPSEGPGQGLQHRSAVREELRPACSRLDEFLGRGSVAKIPEEPTTAERRDFPLDEESKQEKEDGWDDDFLFGGDQRRAASRGRVGRRQSVSRFSGESSWEPKPEPGSKPAASMSPVQARDSAAAWLGLKEEAALDLESPFPSKASPAMSSRCRDTAGQPSPASQVPVMKEAAAKPSPAEEDDWLSSLLAQDKARGQAKAQERSAEPSEGPGQGLQHRSAVSQPAASTAAPAQAAALPDQAAGTEGSGHPVVPGLSTARQASAQPPEAAKEDPSRDTGPTVPMALTPGEQETQGLAPLAQVTTARAPTAQLCEDAAGCQAARLSAQARIAELESQVRILELERTQQDLLLESLQRQHQEELNVLERTHRSQMQVLKESYEQREEKLQWEIEQLRAQMLTQSQDAERARAELVAQHQQQLAMLDQQNTQEMERVRELQRVSVQALRRDHEEQLQRLKRQKDREVEALTSAISLPRSLPGDSEQLEIPSDRQALLHKVEATQHLSSGERDAGPRQQKKQLQELQDRLLQHQRAMEEDRSQLWEAVGRIESRLSDQTRLLQQTVGGLSDSVKDPWPRAARVPVPSLPSRSALQLSSGQQENKEQHLPDTCRMQAEYQARLQAMQQHLEQLKQQEQRVHQANTPSPSLLLLGPPCQLSEPLQMASVSRGWGRSG